MHPIAPKLHRSDVPAGWGPKSQPDTAAGWIADALSPAEPGTGRAGATNGLRKPANEYFVHEHLTES